MTSYIILLSKIEQFCNAHLQIKKYGGEFREQMPNFSTKDEKYPVVFVEPTSDLEDINTNQFSINVYCVDIIQKDRANLNTILSDCQLILKDLYTYYSQDNDSQLDVVGTASMSPLNNYDSDYVAGWVMGITFEVAGYGSCVIPMEPIIPTPVTCPDATVTNSDESYTATVESGGNLVLPDVTIQVIDQDGNELSNLTYPSVQDEIIEVTIPPCPDVNYRITDTANNTLYEGSVPCGASINTDIQNSTVSNSNDTYTASVLAEGNLELPDVTFSVNNTAGTQVNTASVPSVTNQTLVAPDATLNIKKLNDGTITNLTLASGTANNYSVADNALTVNQANSFSIHATDPLDIRLHNQNGADLTPTSVTYNGNANHVTAVINTASFAPVGATLMKTGQTTSYRTGDDGNLQSGRSTNFTTLASNNPFGNTNRFTDTLGGQTYANNIAIDWSTYNNNNVLGYKRTATYVVSGGWNNAIDTCLAVSIGTYTSGWRLANINEWNNILNRQLSNPLGYSPFTSFNFTYTSHTSNTYNAAPSVYSWGINSVGYIFLKDKNETSSCLVVRTFTVNGTTLS